MGDLLGGVMGQREPVAAFVESAVAEFGGVDAIDHNAAWSHPRLDTDAVGVDLGVWERAIEITTRGALLLARHAIPVMTEGGGGSIVTISSGTSTVGESTRVAYGVWTSSRLIKGGRPKECWTHCPSPSRPRSIGSR